MAKGDRTGNRRTREQRKPVNSKTIVNPFECPFTYKLSFLECKL